MNPVLKRTLTGISIGVLVIAAIVFAPIACFRPVVSVLALLAIVEYAMLLRIKVCQRGMGRFSAGAAFLVGAMLIAAGLMALPEFALRFDDGARQGNLMLLYVVAIIKFSDVGGFAFGLTSARMMRGGNHKLCPTISPNKSWEGLFGSLFVSSLISCAFMPVTGYSWQVATFLGCVAALTGTAGDLVESKFKRWVGVKDSSTMKITNGMGGLLDMFDSLLLAPAVLLTIIAA